MNSMIGELTGKEAKEYIKGASKFLPKFTHHASKDAVKMIVEEFKLDLSEIYPDKKIAVNETEREKK